MPLSHIFSSGLQPRPSFVAKTGKVVLFATRACQHSNLQLRKSFKEDDDTDYDEFLEFLQSGLLQQNLIQ